MAACLTQLDLPYVILEQSQHVGHAWHHHYDRLHLHTVRRLSGLPHLDIPADWPKYLSRTHVVDYLEQYARHFNIQPRFGQEVTAVRPRGGSWVVHTRSGESWWGQHVIVATGLNRKIHRPPLPGEDQFEGAILHSRAYRNPDPFCEKRVLVVGMGNTGSEIALDLSERSIPTWISVRHPVNIVPRDFFGNSTQETALKLARLPRPLGDRLGRVVQRLAYGDLSRYGLQQPPMPPATQLRLTGKTPVIDLGTVAQIKAGKIKVKPGIDHLEPRRVLFADGSAEHFSAIILATGYRANLQPLFPDVPLSVDSFGAPRYLHGQGALEGVHFLGFDNYSPGGILGIVRRDAPRIAQHIVSSPV